MQDLRRLAGGTLGLIHTGPSFAHVASRDFSAVIVCVGAGSRFEAADQNGVAHLLEHAAFLGAGKRDYRDIREAIDRLGGDVSAETGEETIMFWGSVNEQRDFPDCLDLVADLVLAPAFDPEALRREIGTVVQEISGVGDDVFQLVVEATKRLLWPAAAVGRPVGGQRDILRRLDVAACRQYWQRTHTGERMLVLVVGTAAESRLARQRFKGELLRGPIASRLAPLTGEDFGIGERFCALPMWGDFVRLCFGMPGISWSDPRLPAVDILNGVLGRDETSRLWERIRGQGLSYSTESFVDCFSDTGWLGVLTDAPLEAAGDVVRIVKEELRELAGHLGRDEFERARASQVARVRNDEIAAPIEWAKYQAICGYFLGRIPSIDSTVHDLEAVTFDQVRQAARDLYRADRLVLAAGGPEAPLQVCRQAFEQPAKA